MTCLNPECKQKTLSTELRGKETIFNSLPYPPRKVLAKVPGNASRWGLLKRRPCREGACPRNAPVCESVLGHQSLSLLWQFTSETGTHWLWKSHRRKLYTGLGRENCHYHHWSGLKLQRGVWQRRPPQISKYTDIKYLKITHGSKTKFRGNSKSHRRGNQTNKVYKLWQKLS